MKRTLCALLSIFLAACSPQHAVYIPKKPCLIPDEDYNFYLCTDFQFSVDGVEYYVPAGFHTDLASTPRILWPIFSPSRTDTIPGAIIHDYLYFCPETIDRKLADEIFYAALIYEGTKPRIALEYYIGVRLFGHKFFHDGAICIHDNQRTENTNGYTRMAGPTTSRRA